MANCKTRLNARGANERAHGQAQETVQQLFSIVTRADLEGLEPKEVGNVDGCQGPRQARTCTYVYARAVD